MPNRILHERICVSETVARLSPAEERFFYRLLVQCDDYGRFDGRESVIRARCFPLQLDGVTDADVGGWLATLVKVGLVECYAADGGQYLRVITWDRYQQTRAKRSKYPPPPTPASNGNQMLSGDGLGSRIRESRSENPEARTGVGARARAVAADAAPPADLSIAKTRPPNPNALGPLVDAFSALGMGRPNLGGREAAAAAALLERGPPERLAQCWLEIAAGEYGGDLDQRNLSFRWLSDDNRFTNWLNFKDGKYGTPKRSNGPGGGHIGKSGGRPGSGGAVGDGRYAPYSRSSDAPT